MAICPALPGALSCLPNLPPYVRCALSKQLKSIPTVIEHCCRVTSGKSDRARLDFDPDMTLTTISGDLLSAHAAITRYRARSAMYS